MRAGKVVMPLVFVDGSRGEVVAPPELGIQSMSASIHTAGGLRRVDRTLTFRYGEPVDLVYQGPLESCEGYDGGRVEVRSPRTVSSSFLQNLLLCCKRPADMKVRS
jgi:hypothetical protein